MPLVSIRHRTTYRYRNPVSFGEHRMMFRPREGMDQRVVSSDLHIDPVPTLLRHVHDVSGNCVGVARFVGRSDHLTFDSHVQLDHDPGPAFAGEPDLWTGALPFAYDAEDLPDLQSSMGQQFPDPDGELAAWARRFVRPSGSAGLPGLLTQMTQAVHEDFRYGTRLHGAPQSPLETLRRRGGSCRDFAVLMIEAVRSLGLAARFVSGYVYSVKTPQASRRLGGGHTHAWTQVYLPACGWVEFDPTNGIVGSAGLVRVAVARGPRQVLPLHGTWTGLADDFLEMDVEVQVEAFAEASLQPIAPLRLAAGGG